MSPWQKIPRKVEDRFSKHFFKPRGIPMSKLKISVLAHDELEALRLMDIEKMSQIDAAKRMKISRGTLQRILELAREKITSALIHGNAIEIDEADSDINYGRRGGQKGRNRGNK